MTNLAAGMAGDPLSHAETLSESAACRRPRRRPAGGGPAGDRPWPRLTSELLVEGRPVRRPTPERPACHRPDRPHQPEGWRAAAEIEELCRRAVEHGTAAVCIYAEAVSAARPVLQGSAVRLATVANFPTAATISRPWPRRPRRPWPQVPTRSTSWRRSVPPGGDVGLVGELIEACRRGRRPGHHAQGDPRDRLLREPDLITAAARAAVMAGVDFLKTSTGKSEVGATLEAAATLLAVMPRGRWQGRLQGGWRHPHRGRRRGLPAARRSASWARAGPRPGPSALAPPAARRSPGPERRPQRLLMQPYLPQEIIRAKRDGNELAAEEIDVLRPGMTDGSIAEGQVAALAMAVFLRGMTRAETVALTLAMRDSGRVLDWRGPARPRGRQAFDRRHRRQGQPRPGAGRWPPAAPSCRCCPAAASAIPAARSTSWKHPGLHDPARPRPSAPRRARGGLRHHRPDRRSRTRRPPPLRDPRRDRDGREHPADHRLDPGQEARRRAAGAGHGREDAAPAPSCRRIEQAEALARASSAWHTARACRPRPCSPTWASASATAPATRSRSRRAWPCCAARPRDARLEELMIELVRRGTDARRPCGELAPQAASCRRGAWPPAPPPNGSPPWSTAWAAPAICSSASGSICRRHRWFGKSSRARPAMFMRSTPAPWGSPWWLGGAAGIAPTTRSTMRSGSPGCAGSERPRVPTPPWRSCMAAMRKGCRRRQSGVREAYILGAAGAVAPPVVHASDRLIRRQSCGRSRQPP